MIKGEGWATQKYDGTACMMRGGNLFKRFDAKKGKTPPAGFEPCQEPDSVTGHWPGWVPMAKTDYIMHEVYNPDLPDGTYELIGPKVGTRDGVNCERVGFHMLMKHGDVVLSDVPRDYDGLRKYLETHDIEGIVFYHPDGRMVKIKKRDFGVKR